MFRASRERRMEGVSGDGEERMERRSVEMERREWEGSVEMERGEWKGAVESEAGDKCVTHSAIPIAGGSGQRARQENENRAEAPGLR